jgi:L-aspartate oxidase
VNDPVETDVLVIGCGIAGGTAALEAADAGLSVTVLTRAADPLESNTHWAQGGIVYRGEGDSPERLSADIERAGAGLCNPEAVAILAREGPSLVDEFLVGTLGVEFDRTADGALALGLEGGHALPRIVHAHDATGKAIESALMKRLTSHPRVTLLPRKVAVDLLTPSHHSRNRLAIYEPLSCVGAYVLDADTGEVVRVLSRATVLATGGLGQIFLRTTNPAGSRGDGLAMGYRAGARVLNCEYVQFHPTAFHHRTAPCFLISEAVRGAGARLTHADGVPFMERYDARWKDLAPRDVVARAIHQELLATGVPNVYLDLRSYVSSETIRSQFPDLYASCLSYGVDMTKDLVPVVPAAHYACGGLWADADGRTTVTGLWAVGEVACTGLHGANRLASTSLLEGVVWGRRSARDIVAGLAGGGTGGRDEIPPWEPTGTEEPDPALVAQDMSSIKHIMWNYVGLARSARRLARAIRDLRNLEVEIERFYRRAALSDGLVGLRNAVRTALIVTLAAWENRESRGCHWRE